MGMVSIRRAQSADLGALVGLLGELFAIEADFHGDPARQRRGLQGLLDCGDMAVVLVAEHHGAVVGMCTCQVLISTAEGGAVGLVEDVVVTESLRGRGIGALLLGALERWAGKRGLTRLQLLADRQNGAALGFYQANDWVATQLMALRKAI